MPSFEYIWDDEENERQFVFELEYREVEGSRPISLNRHEQPICPPERGHYELNCVRCVGLTVNNMKYRFLENATEIELQNGQKVKYNAPHPKLALDGWIMEFEEAHDIDEILSEKYAKDHYYS